MNDKTRNEQRPDGPQAKPIDQESSLFDMTPEQHQKMVEQLRNEFMAQREKRPD